MQQGLSLLFANVYPSCQSFKKGTKIKNTWHYLFLATVASSLYSMSTLIRCHLLREVEVCEKNASVALGRLVERARTAKERSAPCRSLQATRGALVSILAGGWVGTAV